MSTAPARPPRLIVGLGNPGAEYSETRHNAGFWFCERLADTLGVRFSHESRFHGLVANAREAGMWLLMPQTFMNRSGQAIGALARFYRIEPAEILVVHDELDIPFDTVRLKRGGGHGGHNGIRDIMAAIGTGDFTRVRLGIGRPPGRQSAADFVLRDFSGEEREALPNMLVDAADAVELVASEGLEAAQLKFHSPR